MAFDPTATRSGSEFSTNPLYVGAWLCYINGNVVPIQGFSVTHGVWSIPTFTIEVVADETLTRLGHEDLVQVAIFYLDHWAADIPEWRLLVDGEIVGFGYQHARGGRTMSFRCAAHIRTLKQLHFFFMTNVDDIVASQDPAVRASGFATEGLSYPLALFHKGLRLTGPEAAAVNSAGDNSDVARAASGDDAIKAPFELLYNVIRGVISKEVPDEKRAVPMMNFFARRIRTTRLHNRFVRQPLLEDADALASRRGLFPIFEAARNEQALLAMQRHTSSQLANSGPVYDLLEQVFRLVYMELSMIPNPACVQVTLDPTEDGRIIAGAANVQSEDVRALRPLDIPSTGQDSGTTAKDRQIAELAVRLGREPTLTDITSNGMAGRFNMGRGFENIDLGDPNEVLAHYRETLRRRGVTPHALLVEADPSIATQTRDISSYDISIARDVVRTGQLPRAAAEGATGYSAGMIEHYAESLRITGMTPQAMATLESSGSPTGSAAVAPTRLAVAVNEERTRVINARRSAEAQAAREAEDARQRRPYQQGAPPTAPLRLAQYSVKPQFKFGVPPRCNVFYPSMADSLAYDEDYTAQPTRIYINDTAYTRLLRAQGTNRDFMLHALTVAYPEEANAVMHHSITGPNGVAATGSRVTGKDCLIWPEEFYAGPKVARMALSPWFQTLIQWRNANAPAAGAAVPPAPVGPPGVPTTPTPNLDHSPARRRGGVPTAADYLPNSWIPPADVTRIADAQPPVHYDDNSVERADGRWVPGDPVRCQMRQNRFLVMLMEDLERMFPGHIERSPYEGRETEAHVEYKRPHRRALSASLRGNGDIHLVGRAADIFFPPVGARGRRLAGRQYGDPVAQWLITHAAEIGIQFLVWAQGGWTANRAAGQKHHPYGIRNGVPSAPPPDMSLDDFLHNTHIHVEINAAASRGETPYFQARARGDVRSVVAAAPVRTVTRPDAEGIRNAATGVLNTAGQAVATPHDTTTQVAAATLEDADEFQRLFYLYAQYEFFNQKYNARVNGATYRFNPYVVAGFPSMVFDSMRAGFHTVAYVQQVTHTASVGSQGSMQTTVQFNSTRVLPEFMADLRRDAEFYSRDVASAPAEMIDEIRETLQVRDRAEIYYQRLLYGHTTPPGGGSAAFDIRSAVGYATESGDVEAIEITESSRVHAVTDHGASVAVPEAGTTVTRQHIAAARAEADRLRDRDRLARINLEREEALRERAIGPRNLLTGFTAAYWADDTPDYIAARALRWEAQAALQAQERVVADLERRAAAQPTVDDTYNPPVVQSVVTTVSHNINPNREVVPLPGAASKAFEEYDAAMRAAARPVCTLNEYIEFWHGGERVGALLEERDGRPAQVEGEVTTFAYASVAGLDVNTTGGSNGPARTEAVRSPATYYRRIYRLRQGPGPHPAAAERGYTDPPFAPSPANAGVSAAYPETRTDWDAVLIAYADKVRNIQFER